MKIDAESTIFITSALRYYANLLSKRKDKNKSKVMDLALSIERKAKIQDNKPDFEEDCEKCE